MTNATQIFALLIFCGVTATLGCGSGSVGAVSGQVTIDGVAAETGTISFKPAETPTGKGFGGAVSAGRFELPSNDGMRPGKYLVAVMAMKSTGKTLNDPQRGPVPMLQALELADSPQEVEITGANAQQMQLAFATKKK
jgi:hypothetical protein